MNVDVEEKSRSIIPRWRDFKTTLSLGELRASIVNDSKVLINIGELNEQIEGWQQNKSLAFATDLVGASLITGKTGTEIETAINFILSDESQATELQKKIAQQAKNPDHHIHLDDWEATHSNPSEIVSNSKQQIRIYRSELRDSLRNPIKLVELAREHATLGHLKKALRAMDIAIELAPANRFVLRSAARLYVHANEIEKAHYILRRAPSLRSDPWLLAAEIAVSSKLNRTSQNIKRAIQSIENTNYSPFELSELTSAIATLETINANRKRAAKLFKQALKQPTENSIAQAEWASRIAPQLNISIKDSTAPFNHEAIAWNQYIEGDITVATNHGISWILDQPFSVSPVLFVGHIASLLENLEMGKNIYNFGLCANPENKTLRNNLAFILATNNEPELAEAEMGKIDRTDIENSENIAIIATEGLIKFRKGIHDQGRALYRQAIDLAQKNNEQGSAFRAQMYLAREEINARTGMAIRALEIAEKEAKRFRPTLETNIIFQKLKSAVESNREILNSAKR